MKTYLSLLIFLLICLSPGSCKSKTKSRSHTELKADSNYLMISFISLADGIDYNAFKEVKYKLDSFNRLQNDTLEYAFFPWGREGEINLCIKNEQKVLFATFATYIDSLHGKNPRMHILKTDRCGTP